MRPGYGEGEWVDDTLVPLKSLGIELPCEHLTE